MIERGWSVLPIKEKQEGWSPLLLEISQTVKAHPSFKQQRELVVKQLRLRTTLGEKIVGGNVFVANFRERLYYGIRCPRNGAKLRLTNSEAVCF